MKTTEEEKAWQKADDALFFDYKAMKEILIADYKVNLAALRADFEKECEALTADWNAKRKDLRVDYKTAVGRGEAAFIPPREPTFLELALADIEETGNNGVQDILVASYLQAKIIRFLINGLLVKLTEIVADSYRTRVWG